MFDISYFRNNPLPFYTLAHELYPGTFKPTVSHSFIKLLHDKGRLLKLFTQNIDCLEREAGVPGDMIVEAHGSFATQRCIDCKTEYPEDLMKKVVMAEEVPRCLKKTCNGLVKPDIVFFGEPLPEEFHRNRSLPADADLAIVMGTSLTVQPFASLPSFVKETTPRILINLERVGGLGGRADDVLLLGDCDDGVRKLADALGWREELEDLWRKTVGPESARKEETLTSRTRDERLEDEVEKLTRDIDKSLKLSESRTAWLKDHLSRKHELQDGSKGVLIAATTSPPQKPDPADGADSEAAKNGDASSSSAAADAQEDGKGGITHVYSHMDEKAPGQPEKSSL